MQRFAPYFTRSMMNGILFGCIMLAATLPPFKATPPAVALVLVSAVVVFLPFFQPMVLFIVLLTAADHSLLLSAIGIGEGKPALDDPTLVRMLLVVVCTSIAPQAYPIYDTWDARGAERESWFVFPPIVALIFAGLAHLAGAGAWLTIGLPIVALAVQMIYGLRLDFGKKEERPVTEDAPPAPSVSTG